MKMEFTIRAQFQSAWDNFFEEKVETTDNWQQAFGAFTIYASDPDCIFCSVTYKDMGFMKMALQYHQVEAKGT